MSKTLKDLFNETEGEVNPEVNNQEGLYEQTVVLGIDLGTTNSVVSFIENGRLETLRMNNQEIIPSVLFFETPEKILFGVKALNKALYYPQSAIRSFKRRLGGNTEKYKVEYYQKGPGKDKVESTIYIIDTNVFIDDPEILARFSQDDKIIVSTKVIDELSYRKNQVETEFQADVAIKNIEESRDKLVFENSDSSFLPEDLDTRLNDNLILSIALKLRDKDPILLTSDKDLQLKCITQDVKTVTLKNFILKNLIHTETQKDFVEISGETASALFLEFIKNEAIKSIGPVSNAVITVPANFNNVEVEATKRAGEKAGFSEITILKEPTAAAIAYGLDIEERKKIVVYDFGGGTFDVSIIESMGTSFEVLKTGGDSQLGERILLKHLSNTFMINSKMILG